MRRYCLSYKELLRGAILDILICRVVIVLVRVAKAPKFHILTLVRYLFDNVVHCNLTRFFV